MKKLLLSCVSVILSLVIIFNFSTQEASAHHIKVTWDGMELKKGQIGSIYIKKSTKIYNYIDGELVFYKTAKAKVKYRVYKINKGTQTYSLGSKQYIKISDKNITYKNAPKSKINQVSTVHDYAYRGTYWGDSRSQVKKAIKSKLLYEDKETLLYETKSLGYSARLQLNFTDNKLGLVFVNLKLPQEYYTWDGRGILHANLYKKLKSELNTKSSGFSMEHDNGTFSTRWNLDSRGVFLTVANRDYKTEAAVMYLQPVD